LGHTYRNALARRRCNLSVIWQRHNSITNCYYVLTVTIQGYSTLPRTRIAPRLDCQPTGRRPVMINIYMHTRLTYLAPAAARIPAAGVPTEQNNIYTTAPHDNVLCPGGSFIHIGIWIFFLFRIVFFS